MKSATFTTLIFVAFGYAANSQQLSLLPQAGLERSTTTVQLNNQAYFAPIGAQLSPKLGARLDYKFKKGHGPYLGVSTNRSVATVDFSSPESGMKVITTSPANLRLHVEGGYQVSTKPIYFTKSKATNKPTPVVREYTYTRKSCGGYSYSSHYRKSLAPTPAAKPTEKGWYVSIQPMAGAAFIPSVNQDITTQVQGNQTSYKYQAGNWNSAIIAGTGLEFGKNVERKFTVTISYLKGLGNLNNRSIVTTSGGKTTVTNLNSNVSNWNLTAGIPITLYKKKAAVKPQIKEVKVEEVKRERKCGEYRSSCRKMI